MCSCRFRVCCLANIFLFITCLWMCILGRLLSVHKIGALLMKRSLPAPRRCGERALVGEPLVGLKIAMLCCRGRSFPVSLRRAVVDWCRGRSIPVSLRRAVVDWC
ncbi:unnamed protein product [Merluccius merluccius]